MPCRWWPGATVRVHGVREVAARAYRRVMSDAPDPVTAPRVETEFTFFVDAELYAFGGGELAATEADLHDAGIRSVDIPTGYGTDLGDRIPVRVVGATHGLRFYAKLLGVRDPLQLEELERVLAAADRRDPGPDGTGPSALDGPA